MTERAGLRKKLPNILHFLQKIIEHRDLARLIAGQLDQIANEVYDTRLSIRVLEEMNTSAVSVQLMASAAAMANCPQNVLVKYRLDFDNTAYMDQNATVQFDRMQLPPIPVSVLLRLFPFGVIIDRDIRIMDAGEKLLSIWGASTADEVRGDLVVDRFVLRRPRDIPFTWTTVSVTFRVTLEKCFPIRIIRC